MMKISDNPKISELASPKALRRMAQEWHNAGFVNLANRLLASADMMEDACV
jgi:hypothetical protein